MSAGPSKGVRWLAWAAVGFGSQGLGQFVLLAVLARYLTPAELGVVTAARVLVGLGRLLSQVVVGPALVQRGAIGEEHVRTAFALSAHGALLFVAAMWIGAPAVAAWFEMPSLLELLRWMAFAILLQAPSVVPEALLQRDLELRPIALSELLSFTAVYMPVGIGLAMAGAGIWSLAAAELAQAAVKSVVLVAARPHPRGILPRRRPTAELMYFGGGFMLSRLFAYSAGQADRVVIGRCMTAVDLGVYGRAHQLMTMPAMYVGEVLDRVLFPMMARFQDDRERLAETYSRGIGLVASLMTAAGGLGVVLGPECVRVVLGPGWDAAVLPFQILAAVLVFRTGYKISDSLARATGKVYERSARLALFTALVVAGALAGTGFGVAGVAAGIGVAIIANYLVMAQMSLAALQIRWSVFASWHVHGLLLAAPVVTGGWLLATLFRSAAWSPLGVLMGTLAGVGVPVAIAARLAPAPVLGQSGMWLSSKLRRRSAGGKA